MKNYKRIALLVIIFILSTVLNVYAADYDTPDGTAQVTLTPSTTEVKAGDTVTVTLSAQCETGIEGIDSTLEYDKTKLELSSEIAASGFTSMSGEDSVSGEYQLSVLYTDTTDAPTQANFVTLTFKVLDGVTADETLSVKLTGIEVGDSDDEWLTVENKEVTLTVVENAPVEDDDKTAEDGDTPAEDDDTPTEGEDTPVEDENKSTEEDTPKNEETKDNTTANKPINNAGLEGFASIAIVGIVILAIVFYAKCRKYRDVK